MTQEEFKKLIEDSAFLGEERQKMLLENAAWMTPDERATLAKDVETTGNKVEEDSNQALEQVKQVEEAIKTFSKDELPKLREEAESKEQKDENTEADKLLEDF
jgi:Ran GTPase-activating protein (RanGAP) involved in mRNA processing and transport